MIILMFTAALILSAIAAWYAIAGLMAIFAAAAIPIAIMGTALEGAKLVVASWLYRNWKEVPKFLKTYFVIALIVLMTLTSMGIFGFLSKAHLDQIAPTDGIVAQIEIIDENIQTQREIINENRTAINQLDSQINKYTELGSVSRGVKARNQQRAERAELQAQIQEAQTQINKFTEEKYTISEQLRTIEAEVGPIKYIAALIYGGNPDSDILEKAVRIVILMLVAVFDPLAVLMLVAANWSLKRREDDKIPQEQVKTETPQNNNDVIKNNSSSAVETNHSYLDIKEARIPTAENKDILESLGDKSYKEEFSEYDTHGRKITPDKSHHK